MLLRAQAFPYQVHSRERPQKASKGEQPFLHTTHCLGLINMYTKYHQNISKGISVIESISFPLLSSFKGDTSNGQQGRETILAHDTQPWPDIYVYQISQRVLELLSTQALPYKVHTCDTSRIMREAPEFEPYLPHSRAGNAISRILNFAIMIFSQATIFTAIGTHF